MKSLQYMLISFKLIVKASSLIFLLLLFMLIHVHGFIEKVKSNNICRVDYEIIDSLNESLAIDDLRIIKSLIISEREVYLLLRKCSNYLQMDDPANVGKILAIIDRRYINTIKNRNILNILYALNKGIYLFQMGDKLEGQKWLDKAKNSIINNDSIPKIDFVRLFIALGKESFETRDFISCLHNYFQSLSQKMGNSVIEENTKLICLGRIQLAAYYFNKLDTFKWAKAISDSIFNNLDNQNNPQLLGYYFSLTAIYLNRDINLSLARNTMNHITDILQKYYFPGYYKYGLLYYYQGQCAYIEGDYEKALGYLKEAENYLKRYPCLTIPMYQLGFLIGNIWFFYKNDYALANQYYSIIQQSNNPWIQTNLISSYLLSGYSYLSLGDTERAVIYAKKGVDTSKKVPFRYWGDAQTYACRCLSGIYKKIGKNKQAHNYLFEAYEISSKKSVGKDLKATILRDIGAYYKNEGKYLEAIQSYQQALMLYSDSFHDTLVTNNPIIEENTTEGLITEILNMKAYTLYLLYENGGKETKYLDAALQCQETSIKLLEKRIINMDNENSEFNWIDRINVSYNNAISYASMLFYLTGSYSFINKCFQYAEKNKMLAMLVTNHKKSLIKYAGVPDSLIKKENQLRNEILSLQNQLCNGERECISHSMKDFLLERLAFAQLKSDNLKIIFEKFYERYFNFKYNLNVLNIDDIQTNLEEDQILLEYQLLNSELMIMIISKNKTSVRMIPMEGNEIEQITNIRKNISENPFRKNINNEYHDFIHSSYFLYRWLLGPVKEEIRNKRLIIVPHNEINYIPFELLITEKPTPIDRPEYDKLKYVLIDIPISYAYSGTLIFDKHPLRKSTNKVAFFLPEYTLLNNDFENKSSRFTLLPGAREEVLVSQRILGGDLYMGKCASETRFKSEATKYKLIHIASHTMIDSVIPTLSSLILTLNPMDTINDGILHSYEVYQLNLLAQLVVLSGCNTGYGRLQNGEGLLSLARSFFFTGVLSVAYTLWPISDRSSANLIANFYKEVIHGQSLDLALRNAKLKYLKHSDPVKSHPYFWAGYILAGKIDPIQVNKKLPIVLVLLLLVTIVGLCLWVHFKLKTSSS